METLDKVQELLSVKKTGEALALLGKGSDNLVLLHSRYNGAFRQFDLGMLSNQEFDRTKSQINAGILEILKNI